MTINKLNGTECGTEIAKKINDIIDEKASVSLDNLDTDGQAILDGKVNSSDLFDENEHIKINKLQTYSLPSRHKISLTIGASHVAYTAPADGWFVYRADVTEPNSYVLLGSSEDMAVSSNYGLSGNGVFGGFIPVKKGDLVYMDYLNIRTWYFFLFIYAQGAAPQS